MRREHTIQSAYTQLEYLEKDETGVQYIDTCFIANQDTRIVCEFMVTKYDNKWDNGAFYDTALMPYGSRYVDQQRQFILYIPALRYYNNYFRYENQNYTFSQYGTLNKRYKVDANKNNHKLYYNNSVIQQKTFTYRNFTTPFSIFLFNTSSHNTDWGGTDSYLYSTCNGKLRIYYCQIYDNGTLIRDYIPMLRSDGKPGMYDLCGSICPLTNTPFYTNAGTGEFLYN